MNNKTKSIFAPSKAIAAIVYVVSIFVFGVLFTYLSALIIANARGIDLAEIMQCFKNKSLATDTAVKAYHVANGWGNLFSYLLAFILVCFWMRNHLLEDYQAITQKKKKYAILIPVFAISFGVLATGIDHTFSLFIDSSANQKMIEDIFTSSAVVPMIISTVLLAPVVEELIYRKAIFEALKSFHVALSYAASIILFTLPHMLSTTADIGTWLLQCVPYALCGAMLCFIYHKSNRNVYASIVAHMVNNLLAVLFLLL